MDFSQLSQNIHDPKYNHIFDMIIKKARHRKRKARMQIPYQYAKTDTFIHNQKSTVIHHFIGVMRGSHWLRGQRLIDQRNKELKIIRNRIKHQTRCTVEKVYNLMKFEDEV